MRRVGRRRWLSGAARIAGVACSGLGPVGAMAQPRSPAVRRPDDPAITLDLPQLRYSGDWNPRPGALRELATELRLRTRLEPVREPSTVAPDSPELYRTPFLYVAGEDGLSGFGTEAEVGLRRFLDLGGMIVFDAADGGSDPTFTRDVKALLQRVAPNSVLAPIGRDHVLYRSFYILEQPAGRTMAYDHTLGIQEEGRIKVLLVRNDLGGALARRPDGLYAHPCTPRGAEQREQAIRLGVNILLYATCTDYKADRAHVETLLRSRRWR